jgi:hypothetical protein
MDSCAFIPSLIEEVVIVVVLLVTCELLLALLEDELMEQHS